MMTLFLFPTLSSLETKDGKNCKILTSPFCLPPLFKVIFVAPPPFLNLEDLVAKISLNLHNNSSNCIILHHHHHNPPICPSASVSIIASHNPNMHSNSKSKINGQNCTSWVLKGLRPVLLFFLYEPLNHRLRDQGRSKWVNFWCRLFMERFLNSHNVSSISLFYRKSHQKRQVMQVTAENLCNDVWAWRKYGQKPIKGSPYPRLVPHSFLFSKDFNFVSL